MPFRTHLLSLTLRRADGEAELPAMEGPAAGVLRGPRPAGSPLPTGGSPRSTPHSRVEGSQLCAVQGNRDQEGWSPSLASPPPVPLRAQKRPGGQSRLGPAFDSTLSRQNPDPWGPAPAGVVTSLPFHPGGPGERCLQMGKPRHGAVTSLA